MLEVRGYTSSVGCVPAKFILAVGLFLGVLASAAGPYRVGMEVELTDEQLAGIFSHFDFAAWETQGERRVRFNRWLEQDFSANPLNRHELRQLLIDARARGLITSEITDATPYESLVPLWRQLTDANRRVLLDNAGATADLIRARFATTMTSGIRELPLRAGRPPEIQALFSRLNWQRDGRLIMEFRHDEPVTPQVYLADLAALRNLVAAASGKNGLPAVLAEEIPYHVHLSVPERAGWWGPKTDLTQKTRALNLLMLARNFERGTGISALDPDAQVTFRSIDRKGLLRLIAPNHLEIRDHLENPQAELTQIMNFMNLTDSQALQTASRELLEKFTPARLDVLAQHCPNALQELYTLFRENSLAAPEAFLPDLIQRLETALASQNGRVRKEAVSSLAELTHQFADLRSNGLRERLLEVIRRADVSHNRTTQRSRENWRFLREATRLFPNEPALQRLLVQFGREYIPPVVDSGAHTTDPSDADAGRDFALHHLSQARISDRAVQLALLDWMATANRATREQIAVVLFNSHSNQFSTPSAAEVRRAIGFLNHAERPVRDAAAHVLMESFGYTSRTAFDLAVAEGGGNPERIHAQFAAHSALHGCLRALTATRGPAANVSGN